MIVTTIDGNQVKTFDFDDSEEGDKKFSEFWCRRYPHTKDGKYTLLAVNYAKTHTYKECREDYGWSKKRVKDMRKY